MVVRQKKNHLEWGRGWQIQEMRNDHKINHVCKPWNPRINIITSKSKKKWGINILGALWKVGIADVIGSDLESRKDRRSLIGYQGEGRSHTMLKAT